MGGTPSSPADDGAAPCPEFAATPSPTNPYEGMPEAQAWLYTGSFLTFVLVAWYLPNTWLGTKFNAILCGSPMRKAAWHYYYRRRLPRVFKVKDEETGRTEWIRAHVGEDEDSKLYPCCCYPWWGTIMVPFSELSRFGIGVGLYFYLRVGLAVVFVLLGTLNAWTANYFASDAYSEHPDDLSWKIKGSAACFSRTNVCTSPSCLSTAVRNDCPFDGRQAALDLASSLILFAFLGAFAVVERRMATVLDLAAQTAEDYSVAVLDPGPGDTDPEEWRTFFSQWGHVTYVTVAVGNGTLLNALAKRRRLTKLIGMERRGSSVAFGPGFAKDIGVNVAWGARTAAKHVSDAFNGRAEDSTPQAPSADTIDRSGGYTPVPTTDALPPAAPAKQAGKGKGFSFFSGKEDPKAGSAVIPEVVTPATSVAASRSPSSTRSRRPLRPAALPQPSFSEDYNNGFTVTSPETDSERAKSPKPCTGAFWERICKTLGMCTWHPFSTLSYWELELERCENALRKIWAQGPPKVVRIFVTFEYEASQRACLEALTVGRVPAALDAASSIAPHHRFQYGNVLNVEEAGEVDDVVWNKLHKTTRQRAVANAVGYAAGGVLLLFGISLVLTASAAAGPGGAGALMGLMNLVLPVGIKMTVNLFEAHTSVSSKVASMATKMMLQRWLVIGVVMYLSWGPSAMLDATPPLQIQAVLFFVVWTGPLNKALDFPAGFIKRYLCARRAKTQERYNLFFGGTYVNWAERYTDITTTCFIALFYSSVFPNGYFYCAAAMAVNCTTDLYCLVRIWRQMPMLSEKLTSQARGQLVLANLLHMIFSLHMYASWPFDNLCRTDELVDGSAGEAMAGSGVPASERSVYTHCDKIHNGFVAEVRTQPWMHDGQRQAIASHRAFTTLCILVIVVGFYGGAVYRWARSLCYGSYAARGGAKNVGFSKVRGISAFVPQVQDGLAEYPYLCVDTAAMAPRHINWQGPHAEMTLNSARDCPGTTVASRAPYFSTVSFYDPGDPEAGTAAPGGGAETDEAPVPVLLPPGLDPTKAYKEYLRKNRPDVWKRVPVLLEKAQHEEDEFTTVMNLFLKGKLLDSLGET